jgi:hypothetical protein
LSQLGLAFALDIYAPAETPASTPATGRAARRPDRSSQQVQQQQQRQVPAVDFSQWLSPDEMERVQAYADEVMRQLHERPAFRDGDAKERAHLLRRYAAGLLLAGGKALALADLVEASGAVEKVSAEPAPPKEKRGPGRPRKPSSAPSADHPAAAKMRMPPAPRLSRTVEESEAPAPAATRKPQPTAAQVLEMRPAKPPRRAGGQP